MCELLQLRQVGTVEEYRKQFDHLMYELLLYEPPSKIFFVTQFILGLKHELRAYVEPHMPTSVQEATILAIIHQELLDSQKKGKQLQTPANVYGAGQKNDTAKLQTRDLDRKSVV